MSGKISSKILCTACNIEYKRSSYKTWLANHIDEKFICKFCRGFSPRKIRSDKILFSTHRECKFCKKIFTSKNRKTKFCSLSCASKFGIPNRKNQKEVGASIKGKLKEKICKQCNKFELCSITSKICKKCAELNRQKYDGSVLNKNKIHFGYKRSRNEIAFGDLCSKRWKSLFNLKMFNGWDADVILPDLKIAILWNGIWHYEKMEETYKNCSRKQTQNRDVLKVKEIIACGYTPYIIQDLGRFNQNKIQSEFLNLIKYLENESVFKEACINFANACPHTNFHEFYKKFC